jgi:hypothetical protein
MKTMCGIVQSARRMFTLHGTNIQLHSMSKWDTVLRFRWRTRFFTRCLQGILLVWQRLGTNNSMSKQFIRIITSCLVYIFTYLLFTSAFLESINYAINKPTTLNDIRIMNDSYTSWGEHNIVFLLSIICASYFSGFACASFLFENRKINFGLIWSIFITFILGYIYFIFLKVEVGQFHFQSFPITSFIATIASPFLSYVGFINGQDVQDDFEQNTFFGINKIHLIWILFPLKIFPSYFILTGLIYAIINSNTLFWADFRFSYFLWLLTIPPVIAWFGIIIYVTGILQNRYLNHLVKLKQFFIVLAVIVFGCVGAVLLDMMFAYIIHFLIKLISSNQS